MTDNTSNNNKTLSLSLGKKLEVSSVKQSISRSKSKSVMVEVKKSRSFKIDKNEDFLTNDDSNLTEHERKARLEAIKFAEERRKAQQENHHVGKVGIEIAIQRNNDEEVLTAPVKKEDPKKSSPIPNPTPLGGKRVHSLETNEIRNLDALSPKQKEERAKQQQEKNVFSGNPFETNALGLPKKKPTGKITKEDLDSEIEERKKTSAGKPKFGDDNFDDKKLKKLTISQAVDFDGEERVRSIAAYKRKKQKQKMKLVSQTEQVFQAKEIIIPEFISIQDLSNRMAVRVQEVIKELMKLGMIKRAVDEIDADTAELLVTEFKHIPKRVLASDIENSLQEEIVNEADLESRPPVVTIMGHVDHGKTSLLDTIRKADVVSGEAGGITQHIGAYQVTTKNGEKISFIDTPGHAAFTAMRARGANVTDIVILVVAADDGVMPQTIEAINHAKVANVPIIVAVNKIDKPDANARRVKEELLNYDVIVEEYGGEVQAVEISAKQKINIDGLLDAILVQAEMLNLKASKKQKPRGTVIESKIDKGRGVVATLLVQKGTLKKGDLIIAGTAFGKIKTIVDENGNNLETAEPSKPVEVLGFDEVPQAGEVFSIADNEKIARDVVEYRKKLQIIEKQKLTNASSGGIESLFKMAKDGNKELNVIIKGDVHGSVEAIVSSIGKIVSEEVKIKVVHQAAGAISESDIQLASAVKAVIMGFNVRAEANAKALAEREKIEVRYYNIIYNLLDDIKGLVSGLLSPVIREQFLGNAEILQVFKMSKYGKVAGCRIKEGLVKRGAGVRLIRDNVVIHEGKLKTLKRFKDEVAEVKEGFECGMAFENYEDIREGDIIEAFEVVKEQRVFEG
ncbi:MAG: translation initiation factor IF-2 [Rickettsiales bacterium]|nr:translation initiation factor IF-2 [Rickettsiales bacterium]